MRPPDDLLCELIFREIRKKNVPEERVLFIDRSVTVRAEIYQEFHPVQLRLERDFWASEGELLAVVHIAASYWGHDALTTVEYLPTNTTYTVATMPRRSEWTDEAYQEAVKATKHLFEEGDPLE